jgi:hypothetical protein
MVFNATFNNISVLSWRSVLIDLFSCTLIYSLFGFCTIVLYWYVQWHVFIFRSVLESLFFSHFYCSFPLFRLYWFVYILWRTVLVVYETGVNGEKHRLSQVIDNLYHMILYRVGWTRCISHFIDSMACKGSTIGQFQWWNIQWWPIYISFF